MATTLTSLQTKLNNLADETVDATKATSWINDVYKDVASRTDWTWLQSSSNFDTVVGGYSYSPAADCTRIYQVRTKDNEITPQTREWLFANHPEYPEYTDLGGSITNAYGDPTDYVYWDGEVLLYPIPDDVRTVYYLYRKTVSDLSSPSDAPIIPEEHREVLVLGAYTKWLTADEADEYMLQNAKSEYEQKIQTMIAQDASKKNVGSNIPWAVDREE